MAAPTKPFDPEAICQKCLHGEVKVDYSNGLSAWAGGCYRTCEASYSGEHLERRCLRCGYRWAEMVADTHRRHGGQEREGAGRDGE